MTSVPTPSSRTCVVIDCEALRHNLRNVKERCPSVKVMAVIKADGYGHGMLPVAHALAEADEFAVTDQSDLDQLRESGIDKAVTLLSANFDLHELSAMSESNVRPTIYDYSQLELLKQLGDDARLSIWLKVDTGMGRLGFSEQEVPDVLHTLKSIPAVSEISLMTHLANADSINHSANHRQLQEFNRLSSCFEFKDLSALNSAGILNFAAASETIVRPGMMLYGVSPLSQICGSELGLLPVMTLKSRLISVKPLAEGSSIGYGSCHILQHNTRIGIVSCGYGDGYPRHAKSGTPVLINGSIVPLIGRVSMDMIAVDLGDLSAKVGDEAILWGELNPVEVVAEFADTIAYELVCGVLPRVQRVSVNCESAEG